MCRIKFCVDPRKPEVPINSADAVFAENMIFWSIFGWHGRVEAVGGGCGLGVLAGCRVVCLGGPGA